MKERLHKRPLLKKIVTLYIPLLEDFNIKTLDAFVERFYQRMSKERFDNILRSYRIAPNQHRERFVLQALEAIVAARNETHTSQPSESLGLSVPFHEGSITTLSIEQIQVLRNTISEIDEMLETDIDNDKRERLLSRKNNLVLRIQSNTIPESSEEATISLDEETSLLPLS